MTSLQGTKVPDAFHSGFVRHVNGDFSARLYGLDDGEGGEGGGLTPGQEEKIEGLDDPIYIGTNAGNVKGATFQSAGGIAIGVDTANNGTQGLDSIAIGTNAGSTSQGPRCVAVGSNAGEINQVEEAIAIGNQAGQSNQAGEAVSIGFQSGQTSQGVLGIAVGSGSGQSGQRNSSIAIGAASGNTNQGLSALNPGGGDGRAVAIGVGAGVSNQGANTVAIGFNAAATTQRDNGVAIGTDAGVTEQGTDCIAIGRLAGNNGQIGDSIAIGRSAGLNAQGEYAIAIGFSSGADPDTADTQGQDSICIGRKAYAVYNNTIALNATGTDLYTNNSGFFVKPVTTETQASHAGTVRNLNYDTSSGEFVCSSDVNPPAAPSGVVDRSGYVLKYLKTNGQTFAGTATISDYNSVEINDWTNNGLSNPFDTSTGVFTAERQGIYAFLAEITFESSNSQKVVWFEWSGAPNEEQGRNAMFLANSFDNFGATAVFFQRIMVGQTVEMRCFQQNSGTVGQASMPPGNNRRLSFNAHLVKDESPGLIASTSFNVINSAQIDNDYKILRWAPAVVPGSGTGFLGGAFTTAPPLERSYVLDSKQNYITLSGQSTILSTAASSNVATIDIEALPASIDVGSPDIRGLIQGFSITGGVISEQISGYPTIVNAGTIRLNLRANAFISSDPIVIGSEIQIDYNVVYKYVP